MISDSDLRVGMVGVLCPREHGVPLGVHGPEDDEGVPRTRDVRGRLLFRVRSRAWGRGEVLFLEHEVESWDWSLAIGGGF